METSVHCVVDPYHLNIAHHHTGEEQLLPRPAEVLGAIHHSHPLLGIQGHLHQIRIRPITIIIYNSQLLGDRQEGE